MSKISYSETLKNRKLKEFEEDKCYYCDEKAVKVAICNDWDNIFLCNKEKCFNKFKKESLKSQFFIQSIKEFKGELA